MKANTVRPNWISIVSIVVSILAALFIFAILTGRKVPLISGDKAAFFILWIIGLSMSALAGIRDNPDGTFQMPGCISIPLMLLGFSAVLLLIAMLVGIRVPPISGYREAFVALAIIIAAKWVIVHLYNLIQGILTRAAG